MSGYKIIYVCFGAGKIEKTISTIKNPPILALENPRGPVGATRQDYLLCQQFSSLASVVIREG
jgi:hypothetical protein